MIRIFDNTKVFVYCPARVATGGAELLHQVVHILNEAGRAAYIVYHDDRSAKVPVEYQNYNLKVAAEVEDSAENILVLYEALFDKYRSVKNCQLICWWLSVDNFYICSTSYLSVRDYLKWDAAMALRVLKHRAFQLLKGHNYFSSALSLKELSASSAVNCYQSEYAQHFLHTNGFSEILPLMDFINLDFYSPNDNTVRENKVLYNPKKGFKFTQQLMSAAPHLKWVALENMSRAQLLHEFQTSKLYVDFGYHPGKDRIPREAAINGCCVITNRAGSARYFEDVSIYKEYKFDERTADRKEIIALMDDIMADYDKHAPNFDFYRTRILKEKEEFVQQVYQLFSIKNTH